MRKWKTKTKQKERTEYTLLFENLNKINTRLQDIKVRGKSKQLWE